MLTALVGVAVGAAVVLLALSQVWWHQTSGGDGMPVVEEPVTGGEVLPFAQAGALVALAGVLAIVASRRVGRLVAGVVVLLAGLIVAVPTAFELGSAWSVVTLLGGVLIGVGGLLTALRGRHWPAMGRKYDAGGAAARAAGGSGADASGEPVDADEAWRSLDRGEDPTR